MTDMTTTWYAGLERQVPATFRTRNRLFQGRIYRKGHHRAERLCEHEHTSEGEARRCAEDAARLANEAQA